MSQVHPLVPLGEILQLQRRWIKLNPTQMYTEIGIRSFGKGIFHKTPVLGASLGNKRVLEIHPGDIVFSNVFAWEGAVAVASQAEAGKIGSHRFVTYTPISDKCDLEYLQLFFCSEAGLEVLRRVSPGSAGRNRTLNIAQFAKQLIPLPPLEEQRRVVARVEELAVKIEEARKLKRQTIEKTKNLVGLLSQKVFGVPDKLVGDIADVTKLAGFEYTKYFTHASPGNVKVVRAGNVRNRGLDLSNAMTITEEVSDALPRSQLMPGDVVMTFIGANIGDVTCVTNGYPRLHCGPNVAKITPYECISNFYLVRVLQSSIVQNQIEEIKKSTAQASLSMKTIRKLQIPVPPLPEQCRIVAYLDELHAKVDTMKRLREEAMKELDALLPSIFDKAFKGEL